MLEGVRHVNNLRSCRLALAREPPEEAVRLPLRTLRRIGHAFGQFQNDPVESRRCGFVHGLIQIIRRSVVAILQPLLVQFLLRDPGKYPNLNASAGMPCGMKLY